MNNQLIADSRVRDILKSMNQNVDDLRVPLESIVQRLNDLGLTNSESDANIKVMINKIITALKEGSDVMDKSCDDINSIGRILNKIFNPSK